MTLQAHSKEICVLGYFTALCSRQVPAQVGADTATVGVNGPLNTDNSEKNTETIEANI